MGHGGCVASTPPLRLMLAIGDTARYPTNALTNGSDLLEGNDARYGMNRRRAACHRDVLTEGRAAEDHSTFKLVQAGLLCVGCNCRVCWTSCGYHHFVFMLARPSRSVACLLPLDQGLVETRRKLLGLKSNLQPNWTAYAVANHVAGNHEKASQAIDAFVKTLKVHTAVHTLRKE